MLEKRPPGKPVRFELPFNIWCGGCGRHLAMGVRFNAFKSVIGVYLDVTEVLAFRMRCPTCPNWFTIQTNPALAEYEVVEGARRKAEAWSAEAVGLKAPMTDEQRLAIATNPFAKAEHVLSDKAQLKASIPKLVSLKEAKDAILAADFSTNVRARKQLRARQKSVTDEETRRRLCLTEDFELLPERVADAAQSRSVFSKDEPALRVVQPGEALRRSLRGLPSRLQKHVTTRAPNLLKKQ